jgi:hypothetical protein
MYIYICLQFEELILHLPVPVLLRESMAPILSGSTSEHRGSNTHPLEHRGSNDHRGLNKHRGFEHRCSNKYHHLEHRGSNKHRGFTENRGSTQFRTQYQVAIRAKLQYIQRAYALSSTSLSILILIFLLSIAPGSYFTRKQSPIDLVESYYFIIREIRVDSTAP